MDRYQALSNIHSELTEPETLHPYRLGNRTAYKHRHVPGVTDALDGSDIQSFTSRDNRLRAVA